MFKRRITKKRCSIQFEWFINNHSLVIVDRNKQKLVYIDIIIKYYKYKL